jgi:Isocitrate/isopropylmalate dehydrogenase
MAPSRVDARRSYKIASIPADGIGPEVIEAGITVLKNLATTLNEFDLEFTNFDWSSDTYKKTGKYIPDDALTILKKFDAILFGAVGAPGKQASQGEVNTFDTPKTYQTIFLCGASASLFVSHFSNMPMSVPPKSSGAHAPLFVIAT